MLKQERFRQESKKNFQEKVNVDKKKPRKIFGAFGFVLVNDYS